MWHTPDPLIPINLLPVFSCVCVHNTRDRISMTSVFDNCAVSCRFVHKSVPAYYRRCHRRRPSPHDHCRFNPYTLFFSFIFYYPNYCGPMIQRFFFSPRKWYTLWIYIITDAISLKWLATSYNIIYSRYIILLCKVCTRSV